MLFCSPQPRLSDAWAPRPQAEVLDVLASMLGSSPPPANGTGYLLPGGLSWRHVNDLERLGDSGKWLASIGHASVGAARTLYTLLFHLLDGPGLKLADPATLAGKAAFKEHTKLVQHVQRALLARRADERRAQGHCKTCKSRNLDMAPALAKQAAAEAAWREPFDAELLRVSPKASDGALEVVAGGGGGDPAVRPSTKPRESLPSSTSATPTARCASSTRPPTGLNFRKFLWKSASVQERRFPEIS